ncbi:MAG: NAD(P)-binding domain-containing protein [Sphaerospermopsis sp.]|nr:NAD(P)-binding domain-containing protein [Sphaerospermopsis sp.]
MNIQKICVIGAGVSGLVAAKTFLEEGYDITVFEKQANLGGVWEKTRSYPGQNLQNTRDTFCFSDFPMPESYSEFPTAEDMRNYLQSYADYFGVTDKIYLQTEVLKITEKAENQPGWVVNVRHQKGENIDVMEYEFDFILMCNGTFSIPKIPHVPGFQDFIVSGGKILHSTQFNDAAIIDNKHVIVVGFGKSAADIATLAVELSKECTLVFRRALWKIPKYIFNRINYKHIFLTRFAEIWFRYHKLRGVEKLLHTIGKPLVWMFWRMNEKLMSWQFNLDACGLVPEIPMEKSFTCTGNLAPENFYEYVISGKIHAKKTEITRYFPGGVELKSGERIAADVVIFGTGFRQDVPLLPEKYRHLLIDEQGNFHLYRNLIHPEIPNIGFVGYSSSFISQLTAEVGVWWLLEYVKGNLKLPSLAEIYSQMDRQFAWDKAHVPSGVAIGTCVIPFSVHYLEELIQDMGIKIRGNGSQPLQGMMETFNPLTYQKIRQQLRKKITCALHS